MPVTKKPNTVAKRRSPAKRTTSPKKPRQTKPPKRRFKWLKILAQLSCLILVASGAYMFLLYHKVVQEFEARQYAIPARVFARPLIVYSGANITQEQLVFELQLLGYEQTSRVTKKGQFSLDGNRLQIAGRNYVDQYGQQVGENLQITMQRGQIKQLLNQYGQAIESSQLEPAAIGSVYPHQGEDRTLVTLQDLPTTMLAGLIAVEDQNYYQHFGISPSGIARAFISNIQAGRTVQGGSTITQQLVKNLFLSNERSYIRKINEIFMAVALDYKYDKNQILVTYINEVFLAQDGAKAIHGLGLAAQHFFGKPINELNLAQQALLIGIIKGPSFYQPQRHPERATERRNLVLDIMQQQQVIRPEQALQAQAQPLGLNPHRAGQKYPAFMDLIQRELKSEYDRSVLSKEGLLIFTSFDPWLQHISQIQVARGLDQLEKLHHLSNKSLQIGSIITRVNTGEVLAVIGDRNSNYAGFNRALDAIRPPGSLFKPAIALAAIEDRGYSLASQILDTPITIKQAGSPDWTPKNYKETSQGRILFYQMIEQSINQAAARLGNEIGIKSYLAWLKKLGIETPLSPLPSNYLGAQGVSVLDITRMYQTLANLGRKANIRAVKAVLTPDGQILSSYPANAQQIADAASVYQVNYALEQVMNSGTGRYAYQKLPTNLSLAGKTGTTNDQRDSWFAGWTGQHLAVVWIGRDDNQTTPLTGSTGALRIWTDLIDQMNPVPILTSPPDNVQFLPIDSQTGAIVSERCATHLMLPFGPNNANLSKQWGC